jgi:hypothetical protein
LGVNPVHSIDQALEEARLFGWFDETGLDAGLRELVHGKLLGKGGEAAEAIPGRIAMPNTERQFREAAANRSTMGQRLGVVPGCLGYLCPTGIDFTLDIVNIKNKR